MDNSFKSPTILSLCTGMRGLERGLEHALNAMWQHNNAGRNGREQSGAGNEEKDRISVAAYMEIEAFVCYNLVKQMEQGVLAPAPVWTDLKTFPSKQFYGKIHGIVGGYPCFAAGTLVLTKRGYQPIEQIKVNDRVLTHKGRWRRVTALMHKQNAPLQSVSSQGSPNIITTPEHPFFARKLGRKWNNEIRRHERCWGDAEWVDAEKLEHHFTSQVLPKQKTSNRTPAFWWVAGRYLADGWLQKSPSHKNKGRVNICCANKEADFLEKQLQKAGFNPYRSNERTTTRFAITKIFFYKFLKQFGRYSYGKLLPGFTYHLNTECATALCEGYFSGDGSFEKNGGRRATTVSKQLAYGMALLAQRAYGVVCTITKNKSRGTTTIEGRVVSERDTYIVHIPTKNRSAFVEGNHGWKLVRKTEPAGYGHVYNIAVEEDESYMVENCVVHNCQPFSLAGKRDGVEDPRHLFPYIRNIIDATRPVWCFFENVSGHLSMGYDEVYRSLRDLGYAVEAGIYTAEEVGAPHERERLFILAIKQGGVAQKGNASGGWAGGLQNPLSAWQGYGAAGAGGVFNRKNGVGHEADSGLLRSEGPQQQTTGPEQCGEEHRIACRKKSGGWPKANPHCGGSGQNTECSELRAERPEQQPGNSGATRSRKDEEIQAGRATEQDVGNTEIWENDRRRRSNLEEALQRGEGFNPSTNFASKDVPNCPTDAGRDANQKRRWPLANASCLGVEGNGPQGQPEPEIQAAEGLFGCYGGGNRWPAKPFEQQYEWEEPRVEPGVGFTVNGYNFREDLLRLAGNGVVWQTACIAFLDLLFNKHLKKIKIQ